MSKFIRELGKIAVPVTLQSMLQASFSVSWSQFMIGQLGAVSIAAVGLGGNYSMIFNVVSGSVGTVAGVLIAQFLGAGDKKRGVEQPDAEHRDKPVPGGGVPGRLAGGDGAEFWGCTQRMPAIIAEGCVYFKIIAFSFAPMGLSTVLSAWLRCRGHANIPFAASIGAVLSNVVLNYVLIFGKLGLPACGVRGAAIATLVSQLVNLALIATGFLHCLRQDGERVQPSLHFTKITRRDYLGMITPILVSQFLWSLGQNVESAVYGHLGTQNLAAYTLSLPDTKPHCRGAQRTFRGGGRADRQAAGPQGVRRQPTATPRRSWSPGWWARRWFHHCWSGWPGSTWGCTAWKTKSAPWATCCWWCLRCMRPLKWKT